MRSRKHWSDRLRERISSLERECELFAAATRKAEASTRSYRDELLEEKRQHDECKRRLKDVELDLSRVSLDRDLLKRELLNQEKLVESLETTTAELKKVKKELNRRSGSEDPYGLSTPSSKQVNKAGSTEKNRLKRGGAVKGHRGHGRKGFTREEADREINHPPCNPENCDCGADNWHEQEAIPRSTYRFIPARVEKHINYVPAYKCGDCGKVTVNNIPGVMPRALFDNTMIAHMLTEFYFHGTTAGNTARRFGINIGTFFSIAHRVSGIIKPLFDNILDGVCRCTMLHADETGWANDGRNGYAWFFGNDDFNVFICRQTRGSIVPKSILGEKELPLILITDRYKGYAPLRVKRQFCFTHLLRDVKKEEKAFPEEKEVLKFAASLKPLLKEAIALRKTTKPLDKYLSRAAELKNEIMTVCWQQANHPAVQHIQNIFRENEDKMFHWTTSPDIPAENNFAERELRPMVIARKISFGSQSEKGLETRERMMTVMNTASCRGLKPENLIKDVLDKVAVDQNADLTGLLNMKKEGKIPA